MKVKIEKHPIKQWEVSIIEIKDSEGIKYKVTRRIPEMLVAETKIISDKQKAIELFNEWLN